MTEHQLCYMFPVYIGRCDLCQHVAAPEHFLHGRHDVRSVQLVSEGDWPSRRATGHHVDLTTHSGEKNATAQKKKPLTTGNFRKKRPLSYLTSSEPLGTSGGT